MAPSRFRQVNPAFAAAHGLVTSPSSFSSDDGGLAITATNSDLDVVASSSDIVSPGSTQKRIEQAVAQARTTGKLNASNLGVHQLPEEMFDLRKGIKVDLSMDASASANHGSHAEDTVTLVDFSDNPLGSSSRNDGDDHQDDDTQSLEQRIVCYQAVQTIRLRRCELQYFNVSWDSFQQLKLLDLSGNSLCEFVVDRLPLSLLHLNLSSNELTNFDSETKGMELSNLNHLDLSKNRLSQLPTKLRCPKLQTFRCSHNQLTTNLSSEQDGGTRFLATSSTSFQVLDLSHNKLSSPGDFSAFSSLQTLHLSENLLSSPPCIPTSLTQLALSRTNIKSLVGLLKLSEHDTIETSTAFSLVDLILSNNHLEVLDVTVIGHLQQLQRLDVQSNLLKNLPYELGFLPQLQLVSLAGNPLVSFKSSDLLNTHALLSKLRKRAPSTDGQYSVVAVASQFLASILAHNSKVLDLRNKSLKEIPPKLPDELESSPQLASGVFRVLLDHNSLEMVPEKLITALPSLNVLHADHNLLTKLPPNLGHASLVELSLSRNCLRSEELESVLFDRSAGLAISKTLQVLNLSSNLLESFPCFGSQFPCLHTFSLAGNRITSISHWTLLPSTMSSIDLSENSIVDVGEFPLVLAAGCPVLTTLLLRRNDLKQLPPTLGLLGTLCHLDLKGNPQRLIRPAVLEKSGLEVVAFLKNRLTPEQVQHAETRIQEIRVALGAAPKEEPLSAVPISLNGTNVESQQPGGFLEATKHIELAPTTTTSVATSLIVESNTVTSSTLTSLVPMKDAPSEEKAASAETDTSPSMPQLDELQQNIDRLAEELESTGISQAKRFALKKQLAMERSKLIREQRKYGLGS